MSFFHLYYSFKFYDICGSVFDKVYLTRKYLMSARVLFMKLKYVKYIIRKATAK